MVLKCKTLIYFIINKPCRKKIPPHNNYIHAYIVYYSAKVGLRSVFLMSEQFCNTASVRQVSLLNAIWTTTHISYFLLLEYSTLMMLRLYMSAHSFTRVRATFTCLKATCWHVHVTCLKTQCEEEGLTCRGGLDCWQNKKSKLIR